MKTLDFSTTNLETQRYVIEEEVRVNVMNQPYGLIYAIDLPGKAVIVAVGEEKVVQEELPISYHKILRRRMMHNNRRRRLLGLE